MVVERRLYLVVLGLLFLAYLVAGESPIVCPSTEELQSQIVKCQSNGFDYVTTSIYGTATTCKYVECVPPKTSCPSEKELDSTILKCKSIGSVYQYYTDDYQCTHVTCIDPKPVCPTVAELNEVASACKTKGLTYDYVKNKSGCVEISCTQNTCLSSETLELSIHKCESQGGKPTTYVREDGCKDMYCTLSNKCPSSEQLQEQLVQCKKEGADAITYVNDGCKYVVCKSPSKPTSFGCTKTTDEKGCVKIKCEDGYYFDSCVQKQVCQAYECKTYTDVQGCTVKSCSDGYQSIACPKEEVTCQSVKNKETGCEVKECSNGKRSEYCPPVKSEECKLKTNEKGCLVKVCYDPSTGKEKFSAQSCPTPKQGNEVVCKVYDTDNGKVKECDNGFRVAYDELTNCVDGDAGSNAKFRKCGYGKESEYVAQFSADGSMVECVIDFSTQYEICTDGTQKKGGQLSVPEPKPVVSDTAPSNPLDALGKFFASIFGR
jgi:hypothetical protein